MGRVRCDCGNTLARITDAGVIIVEHYGRQVFGARAIRCEACGRVSHPAAAVRSPVEAVMALLKAEAGKPT